MKKIFNILLLVLFSQLTELNAQYVKIGENTNQYFHIVVDNTNNSHSNDAVPETTIAAYVSVVSEPRSTILPNWTVSLVCCGLMLAVLAVPLIMNKRYMNSGLSLTQENQQLQKGLVPTLEQE